MKTANLDEVFAAFRDAHGYDSHNVRRWKDREQLMLIQSPTVAFGVSKVKLQRARERRLPA